MAELASGGAGVDGTGVPAAGERAPKTPPRRWLLPQQMHPQSQPPLAGMCRPQPKPPSHPPPAKLLQHLQPRGPPPARLVAAAAARAMPGSCTSSPPLLAANSNMCWPKVQVVGHIPCQPPSQPSPCLQPLPASQHCAVQMQAEACSPRLLQPLLRPRFQGSKWYEAEAYAEPVPAAKKSAGGPPFLEFHGAVGEGVTSWCSSGTYPVSRFNVFQAGHSLGNAAASSAWRTFHRSSEAIQGNLAVEKARPLAEVEKAAAKALVKIKVDVHAKPKASCRRKDGDEQDDGEDYV